MALALFAGTAILTFAPGNFVRLSSTGRTGISGYITSLICAVRLFLQMKIIWVLLGTLLIARLRKIYISNFLKDNLLISLCFLFAVLLGCVANTLPQSFTGIEFFALILILRLFDYSNINFSTRLFNLTAVLLLIILIIHQSMIVNGRQTMVKTHKQIINEYIKSPTGIILRPETHISSLVRPFVPDWTRSIVPWWTNYTIAEYYGNKDKELVMLSTNDYEIVTNPNSMDSPTSNIIPGSLKCIETNSGYWCRIAKNDSTQNIIIAMHPQTLADNPTWFTKLKFKYGKHAESDILIKSVKEYYSVASGDSLIVRINKPLNRRVKSIDIKK